MYVLAISNFIILKLDLHIFNYLIKKLINLTLKSQKIMDKMSKKSSNKHMQNIWCKYVIHKLHCPMFRQHYKGPA